MGAQRPQRLKLLIMAVRVSRSLSEYPAFAWKFLMECGNDRARGQILFFQVRQSGIEWGSGMSRTFREWSPDQSYLFPPSPQDWLPKSHLVYFLMEVSDQLDLSVMIESYENEKGGKPPFYPQMMLVLLLYSYCIGVFSSRKIGARCETDVSFRVIVGDHVPDFRTIRQLRI